MDKYNYINGFAAELAEYETPFADMPVVREEPAQKESAVTDNFFLPEYESPFATTYETEQGASPASAVAPEFVQLLGELNDSEFSENLYELATELEDSWSSKVSNETAMGDRFVPFATQQAAEYFAPLIQATESMIDKASEYFSGSNFADRSEPEIDRFFAEMETGEYNLTPAQEQFFGSIFKKVKSVVKSGIDLAKKGISAVGKILPIGPLLSKLKVLIRPLLDKVLRFAIGKLPKYLQPHARALANKFLNLEAAGEMNNEEGEIPATAELEAVQFEFDTSIAQLLFSPGETEADQLVMEYESSSEAAEREDQYETGGVNFPPLDVARQQLVNELKSLQPGESPAPAIERFLPVAIMALRPVVKMAISIIGRDKVIDFLANLLSQLVSKYIPNEIAKPLASKIIDIGMNAIGFETFETNRSDVAYEAVANTITDTVRNLGNLNEAMLGDQEALTAATLEAFESAVANNFPNQYVREDLRTHSTNGVWVLKPRVGAHKYKKFSHVFNVLIDPQMAKHLTTFRGIPLTYFFKDKLGLDPSKPVQARVHLFEAIDGTWLSQIAKNEKLPGLSSIRRQAWVQFHPLTTRAAAILLKEPGLGRDYTNRFTSSRHRIAIGQRFYFLEIGGTRVRIHVPSKATVNRPSLPGRHVSVPQSSDVQAVINFVKSEIRINYFFSEEEAKEVVEKLNRNDYLGAGLRMRTSVRNTLNGILLSNVGSKVKIIHEAVPEMFLDNYTENEGLWDRIKGGVKSAVGGVGKEVLMKIVQKIVEKLTELAYQALVNYFKARAAEFKQAQAQSQDGVTVKIVWVNVPGMSTIRAVVNAIKGNLSIGNLADLALPNIPTPDVRISAGKNFD